MLTIRARRAVSKLLNRPVVAKTYNKREVSRLLKKDIYSGNFFKIRNAGVNTYIEICDWCGLEDYPALKITTKTHRRNVCQ